MTRFFSEIYLHAALLAAAVGVAGCGGGGSTDGHANVPLAHPSASASPDSPAPSAQTAQSIDEALARAMATSNAPEVGQGWQIEEPISKLDVPNQFALATSSTANADSPQPASPAQSALTSASTVYYVDSLNGNDANSGKSPVSVLGTTTGPWKTLARLASATLVPGDAALLTCGSSWRETLKLASSGTATAPIVVAAYPAGCENMPTIYGNVSIPAASWSLHKGNIYKAALGTAPLLLTNSSGTMKLAHHPNRGFDSTQPTSLYLRNAANSDSVAINGRTVSTYVTTGADLVLPPGVTIAPGTKIRLRPNAWTIDESTIASVANNRATLATPTSFPMVAGWGYYLLDQLWMLDSPGEWYWDGAAKELYAWMPNNTAPQTAVNAAVLPTGVDLESRQYINIENIQISLVGTGIAMRNSVGISVRSVRIHDTAGIGIDGYNGSGNLVEASTFHRSGVEAISGGGSDRMRIINNTIINAGVIMNSETVLSLPVRSRGAILGGQNSVILGNSVTNSGYNGIATSIQSTVSNNIVFGACSTLDDCAGIYTSKANNNSTISGNIVQNARGNIDGKPVAVATSQAQGIYLDEHASGVTVRKNTAVGNDNGIQLHIASNNVIQGNQLYGNRRSQLWLQETSKSVVSTGDLYGNLVSDNQIAPTSANARGVHLQTQIASTTRFAQFDRNSYLDRIYARISTEEAPTSLIDYTFPTWKSANLVDGTPRQLDVNGRATSAVRYAPALVSGTNIVPNGKLTTDANGWSAWNLTLPKGSLSRQACALGYCASYTAGGSQGLVSIPNFSVVKDQWYRVSVDVLAGADGQQIKMLVRRGGGGTNGYEPLSNVYFSAPASRAWTRFTFSLKANATVNAGDPVTRDNGARLDIEHIQPGQVITIANVEIVPITSADTVTNTALLLNATSGATQAACPVAAASPSLCGLYVRLVDGNPITWPYFLPARSSEIIYTLDPALIDSDGDGIADSQDRCPSTAAGSAVNAAGCALGQ